MKNSKRAFLLLEFGLGVLVILLALVMILENNEDERERISVIVENSEANRWTAFKYGLRMAAQDKKVEIFVVSTGAGLTPEEEQEIIQREMENGADAIIVQPVPGADTGKILEKIGKRVPVMLVEEIWTEGERLSDIAPKEEEAFGLSETEAYETPDQSGPKEGYSYGLPVTEADHWGMGAALAEELLSDYSGKLTGKTFGIVSEAENSRAVMDRIAGFQAVVKEKGAKELWTVFGFSEAEGESPFLGLPKVDIIIAMDDGSLNMAGEQGAANNLHGALVYGIGNSTEAVYYLDTGTAQCLVVPDDFSIGYRSLTAVAKNLNHSLYQMENQKVSYTVMRRDTLFTKENQEILFTMSQ